MRERSTGRDGQKTEGTLTDLQFTSFWPRRENPSPESRDHLPTVAQPAICRGRLELGPGLLPLPPASILGTYCLCHTPRFLWPAIAFREPQQAQGCGCPLHPPAASGGGQWPATPESTLTACDFFLPVQVEHLPPCCLFFLAKVQF